MQAGNAYRGANFDHCHADHVVGCDAYCANAWKLLAGMELHRYLVCRTFARSEWRLPAHSQLLSQVKSQSLMLVKDLLPPLPICATATSELTGVIFDLHPF